MGLQVWLPLNGNINNQGLANTVTTNNGAAIDNNGKIGKCYSFGPSSSTLELSNTAMTSFTTSCSVCFWLKILSWNTSYATFFQAGVNGASWAHYTFGFLRNSTASTCCFTISNGSTASNNSYLTPALTENVWYHIALTYETGHCRVYINGELYKDYATSIVPNFSNITRIRLGQANSGGYQTNCLMNDFRIYDNCLTDTEIKLLSRGLILHYPMNRDGYGLDNLLSHYVSAGQYAPGVTTNGGRTNYYGKYGIVIPASENADTYFRLFLNKQLTLNAVYTISCYVSGLKEGSYYRFPLFTQSNTAMGVLQLDHNGLNSLTFTMTYGTQTAVTADGRTLYILFMDDSGRNIASGQGAITVTNFKLEEGNTVTAWCPEVADPLYTTLIYDTSGYQNNGIRNGSFVWTDDTPKYSFSTNFTGTQYILSDSPSSNGATLSAWVKTTSTSNQALVIDYKSGLGIGFWSNVIIPSCNSSIKTTYPISNYHVNQWNHIVVVKNTSSSILCYVNGELQSATATNDYWSTGVIDGLSIASRPNGASPATCKISDVRIYATALSADDVLDLYNNKL